MNKSTKWLAAIYQKYVTKRASHGSTQIISLSLRAGSAQEATGKAEEWLKKSGIETAYVSEVCHDGLDEVDIDPVDLAKKELAVATGQNEADFTEPDSE